MNNLIFIASEGKKETWKIDKITIEDNRRKGSSEMDLHSWPKHENIAFGITRREAKPDAGGYRMIFILLHALVAGLDVLEFLRLSISRTIGKMLISEDRCWTSDIQDIYVKRRISEVLSIILLHAPVGRSWSIPLGVPQISRINMLRD